MEPNRFEQEVKMKMEQRRLNPTPMAWDRLDAMLSVAETKKPQRSYRWLYIAASMVILLGAGLFFLDREAATAMPSGESPAVVAGPENRTQAESTDTTPAMALPEVSQENPVASSQKSTVQNQPAKNNQKDMQLPAIAKQDEAVAVISPQAPSNEVQVADTGKVTEDVADISPKMAPGKVKVDSRALLSSVEGELDDSFRSKMLQSVTKNYNTVKTALVNRNHE